MTWDGSNDGVALHDGVGVLITLLDNKGQKTVSFPNYLWSKVIYEGVLSTAWVWWYKVFRRPWTTILVTFFFILKMRFTKML